MQVAHLARPPQCSTTRQDDGFRRRDRHREHGLLGAHRGSPNRIVPRGTSGGRLLAACTSSAPLAPVVVVRTASALLVRRGRHARTLTCRPRCPRDGLLGPPPRSRSKLQQARPPHHRHIPPLPLSSRASSGLAPLPPVRRQRRRRRWRARTSRLWNYERVRPSALFIKRRKSSREDGSAISAEMLRNCAVRVE